MTPGSLCNNTMPTTKLRQPGVDGQMVCAGSNRTEISAYMAGIPQMPLLQLAAQAPDNLLETCLVPIYEGNIKRLAMQAKP